MGAIVWQLPQNSAPEVSWKIVSVTAQAPAGESKVDFNRDIRPILAENCFPCHGPDAAARRGELRLDTEAGSLVTANVRRSG